MLLVARGLLPVAQVYLTRPLVDAVLGAMKPGGNVHAAVVQASLMAFVLLAAEALGSIQSWVRTAQAELVSNHIASVVQKQSAAVDLGFYETPDFYDHLHRARSEGAAVPLALIENLGGLGQNAITLAAMAGLLAAFGIWLPIALLASTVPALMVVLRYAVLQHEWWLKATPDQRRSDYYDSVLTSREHAAELRLFGLAPYFQECFAAARRKLAGEKIGMARGQGLAEFAAASAALATGGAALVWMGSRAMDGRATAGDLALFYQAFQQGLGLVRALLGNLGQLYRSGLFLEGLFAFLSLEAGVVSRQNATPVPQQLRSGIRFQGVSFRYPGSDRLALEDFSLDIPAGQILAIVGENGAGKSTLTRLLCRFYDPESGCVELDGQDLREFDLNEVRRRVGVLFQEPAHYNATFADNIAPGNEAPITEIREAARAAGADAVACKLPLGYQQMLGRWFEEGAELSGGEWQRVALARAFLRDAAILVLDEPTSAMDPWAEALWLERFRGLADGRTVVLITHRFTTARVANQIAVMAAGRIVEQGSHEQLLARGGRYAEGWADQGPR